MQKIIDETEVIAYNHLKAFGFKEEQITPLIIQSKKDLKKNLSQLKILLQTETISLDAINNTLHALKGLFFNLGHHTLAEALNDTISQCESETILKEISQLLFEEDRTER